MLALDKKKLSTTLIGFWEDAAGELWLDMTARVLAVYNATNYVISKVADENNQVVFW